HGSLDDQVIRQVFDRLSYLRGLDARREEIFTLIEGMGQMTEEVSAALEKAGALSELDDIYRPFRPKRKTRASIAKEKGLEPLAQTILEQDPKGDYPIDMAAVFVSEEKGVATPEDALAGAMDIIAETISDDASIRKRLRVVTASQGLLVSKAAKEEDSVYNMYYEFNQPIAKIAGHRVLAIDRGEKEGFLKVSVQLNEARGHNIVVGTYLKGDSPCTEAVAEAAKDAYTRLIFPAIEREMRNNLTDTAAESAIKVFATNLRHLLMQPPVKGRVTIGLDPGYRTGCKVAVVDPTGKVLDTAVIYPTHGENQVREAKAVITRLVKKHGVSLMAIGNGTASKETEMFADELIREQKLAVEYMVVSEAGASVYSASKLASEEYPEYDLTLRSAVSIAHRLQDPLAELVKIDPKAIGVGQYQHDMPPKRLDEALSGVVEDCVNTVGVDLNTASPVLLNNVAGISNTVAKNIIAYRQENGEFTSRAALKKVPKLGPKAFEQCAGFLRVSESANILDNTAVHPESYDSAKKILTLCGYSLKKMPKEGFADLKTKIDEIGAEKAAAEVGIGVPTLNDMITELMRPGRDPREGLEKILLRSDIKDIKDLKVGMELMGTVRNVIDFGAFVDIGVHQDGLVHVTQISNKFISHPSDALHVGQIVTVWVLSVDTAKGRIGLTMKSPPQQLTQDV
ncbi:MAG: Tex family protein, partial [Oscillospiraceae bacterium]